MKTVAVGLLGVSLDSAGKATSRWEKRRPTVALCQQEDLLIGRLELLHPPKAEELAHAVKRDIAAVSPETEVVLRPFDTPDPWDFAQVYGALYEFARTYPFDVETDCEQCALIEIHEVAAG